MTTASAPPSKPRLDFDPDQFRMTIGEHLEELRKRLLYGLLGFGLAVIFFFIPAIGERIVTIFCAPLIRGMRKHHLTPQLHVIGLTEGFMTYLQICIVCALVVAGPWLLYQLWLFIAAGLYPTERQTITKYIPLSVALLATGVLFVYFVVLPLTVDFFLTFNGSIPMPPGVPTVIIPNAPLPVQVPVLEGDPAHPPDGAIWYNALEDRLKIEIHGEVRIMQFSAQNLIASTITLDDYISFVLMFMLVFAVAFQLPLVMLALVRVGIIDIALLKKQRRTVWFVLGVVAAIISPGDVVTSMLALLIPLMVLYEFGILLASWTEKKRKKKEQAAADE